MQIKTIIGIVAIILTFIGYIPYTRDIVKNKTKPHIYTWILWAVILIIVAKLFQEDLGRWNVLFVIIGYSFIARVVYTLINAVSLSTLPLLNVPLDASALNALLEVSWRPLLAYQLSLYIPVIGEVWIAALGAVVVRLMKEMTWSKAATISAVAFAIRFLLRLFLGF